MMPVLKRHDFVWLTPAARERIATEISHSDSTKALRMACAFLATEIPGIVRRSAPCDIGIGLGISFPIRCEGSRLRFATSVTRDEISTVVSPCQVIELPFEARLKPLQALEQVKQSLPGLAGKLGIYGATALQMLTGLAYLHDGSDLDLVIDGGTPEELFETHRILSAIAESTGVNIDAEVILDGIHGMKLKELVSAQKTVLAKTLHSVELMCRRDVLQSLALAHAALP